MARRSANASSLRDAHAVGVEQHVADVRVLARPVQQLEKARVQRGFAAGELQDFDGALAVDHALHAALDILQRRLRDAPAGAHGRIGVAGRAGEVARVDDLDERQAGGERLEGSRAGHGRGVASQRAGHGAVGGAQRLAGRIGVAVPESAGGWRRQRRRGHRSAPQPPPPQQAFSGLPCASQ